MPMKRLLKPRTVMVSFRADPELLERLKRIKERSQRPLADVTRRLVELGVRALAGRKL